LTFVLAMQFSKSLQTAKQRSCCGVCAKDGSSGRNSNPKLQLRAPSRLNSVSDPFA
jgi:hypothetical protein